MVIEAEDIRIVLYDNTVRWQPTAFALNAGSNPCETFSKEEYNKNRK